MALKTQSSKEGFLEEGSEHWEEGAQAQRREGTRRLGKGRSPQHLTDKFSRGTRKRDGTW